MRRGSRVRSARADSPGWRRAAAGRPISALPLPGFCRAWETCGSGKGPAHGHPLEGGLGATPPYIFLQITDSFEVSSDVAHHHPLVSIRISIVQMQKLRSDTFSGLHGICSGAGPGLQLQPGLPI